MAGIPPCPTIDIIDPRSDQEEAMKSIMFMAAAISATSISFVALALSPVFA